MKSLLALLTATLALTVAAGVDEKNQSNGANTAMLKAVVHVNFADVERQEDALGNIENILKAEPTAQIEVLRKQQGGYGYFRP